MVSIWTVGDLIFYSVYILLVIALQLSGLMLQYKFTNKLCSLYDRQLSVGISVDDYWIEFDKIQKKIHISKILIWIGFSLGLCCLIIYLLLSFLINF